MRRPVNIFSFIFAVCIVDLTLQQTPTFISNEGYHEAQVGQKVELPCRVSNLGSDYTVYWTKGNTDSDNIIAGRAVLIDDERYSIVVEDDHNAINWDFEISKIEPNDDGVYFCQISTDPPLIQKQMLHVGVPASVHIVPEKNLYTVKVGQSIQLTCHPSGNPLPSVVWSKIGSLLPDGTPNYDGETLHVDHADSRHEGVYRCTGTNGGGVSTAEIKVQVAYAPTVNTTKTIMFISLGASLNVSCFFTANPDPTVEWIFNGFPLEIQSKENRDRMKVENIRKETFSVTTLSIDKIANTEFGGYTCRITNNIGQDEETIQVSGVPGPAQIMLREEKGQELSWIIESADPVLEFRVEYRTIGQDHFKHIQVETDGTRSKDAMYKGVYTFTNLEPNQKYEVLVRGRNTNGWGLSPMRTSTFETDKFYKPAKEDKSDDSDQINLDKTRKTSNVKDDGPRKSASRHFVTTLFLLVSTTAVFYLTNIYY